MKAQDYIQHKLHDLQAPAGSEKPVDKAGLGEAIFKAVMSKKFRKYSVNTEYVGHIQSAISLCIAQNEPIKFSMVFGGYKLWRLDETPEPDWAELFSLMYYTNWVKSICEIYEPGVWFDFYSDDAIVPSLNNIDPRDIEAYAEGFNTLLSFIKPFQPINLTMTMNRVRDQYASSQEFEDELAANYKNLVKTLPGGLPELSAEHMAAIELNVKLKPGQDDDPLWREKVQLLHDAYALVSKRRPYYRTPDKIMVITRPIPNSIAVGTTKDSVMKFWIGVGALRPHEESYRQIVLSANQLEKSKLDTEPVDIHRLEGKNFSNIRIIH